MSRFRDFGDSIKICFSYEGHIKWPWNSFLSNMDWIQTTLKDNALRNLLLRIPHLSMSEPQNTSKSFIILPYQQPVFDRLCAIARACLNVNRAAIGLKLRTSFLLLGPSGCGKTFIAQALADEMQIPFLSISVSDWILLGCSNRGGSATWPTIVDFLERSKQKQGAIIFVDELDKCYHDSNWNTFLRSEIFSLCDKRVQKNINDLYGDRVPAERIEAVRDFLENKTMILAGAAFQDIWEARTKPSMGFIPPDPSDELPELPDLVTTLPRELVNRFSSEMFVMSELTAVDYRQMLEAAAGRVAEIWRKRFLELGITKIEQAVRHRKGARFMEEVLLSAIVEERESLVKFVPARASSEHITVDNSGEQKLDIF